jgi:hypothetical protein
MELTTEQLKQFAQTREPIHTKTEFIDFLQALYTDFISNRHRWENDTLELYLETLVGYAHDIDGFYRNFDLDIDPEKPSWRLFADILWGARRYE